MEYEKILNNCPSPIFVIKPIIKKGHFNDFTYQYVNEAFASFLGISKEKLIGSNFLSFFDYTEKIWIDLFSKTISEHKPYLVQSGSTLIEKNLLIQAFPIDNDCCACIIISFESFSGTKNLNEELFKRANYDALTGCANRYMLEEKIASNNEETPLGVIYFDLNDLKGVNDKYGHEAGDNYIRSFVKTIKELVGDMLYRIGGDEFVAIYPGTEAEFLILVDSLKDFMKKTCLASFGAKYYPNGVNLKNAISECDKLMYKYKQQYFTKNSITR